MSRFVRPGQKVLIKPNALLGETPEHAVTTHPALISAVVKEVIKAGGIALVGDSPGNAYANVAATMEKTGIKKAVETAGGQLIYFQQAGVVGKGKIHIARAVIDADVIINLPKLKTHNLTTFTGAIKNMFGVVPGFNKALYHRRFPNPKDFAAALVDIFAAAKPTLNIMDAIVGMEGLGPSAGQPRKLGVVIASTDGVAIDAVSSYLIGYDPGEIDTTVAAFKRGLGEMRLANIEISGASLAEIRQPDWKRALNLYSLVKRWLPGSVFNLIRPVLNQLKVWPVIDQEKCTRCLVCVNNCPTRTIEQDNKTKIVKINLKDCISCFCCHELCEAKAIRLERSWLVRLLKIG